MRAIGPSLAGCGVSGFLSDPTLTLFDGSGAQIGFNDDWIDSPDRQAIIDTGAPPTNDKESAIIQTLAPGNYTAKVAGVDNDTGVALIELYDLQSFSSSTLANISTRGRVDQGENVLIAGYIVGGYTTQTVVVRGIGPSLIPSGVATQLLGSVPGIPRRARHHDRVEQRLAGHAETRVDRYRHSAFRSEGISHRDRSSARELHRGYVRRRRSTGVALAEVYNITHNF